MVSVPSASSVTTISATLMRAEVLLFSARELVALASSSLLGGAFNVRTGVKLAMAFPSLKPSNRLVAANWASVSSAGTVAFRTVPETLSHSGPANFTNCRLLASRSVQYGAKSLVISVPLFSDIAMEGIFS